MKWIGHRHDFLFFFCKKELIQSQSFQEENVEYGRIYINLIGLDVDRMEMSRYISIGVFEQFTKNFFSRLEI